MLLPDGRPAEPAAAALAEALDAPALARRVLETPEKIRAKKVLAARARARLADAERKMRLVEAEIAAGVAAEAGAGGRARYPNAEARAAELELRKARDPRWRAAETEARRAREEWEAASWNSQRQAAPAEPETDALYRAELERMGSGFQATSVSVKVEHRRRVFVFPDGEDARELASALLAAFDGQRKRRLVSTSCAMLECERKFAQHGGLTSNKTSARDRHEQPYCRRPGRVRRGAVH